MLSLLSSVSRSARASLALLLLAAIVPATAGAVIPFDTTETSPYLLIGMGDKDAIDDALHVQSSEELGANLVPFPSQSPPDLGDVPPLPAHAVAPGVGISNDGNIAITNPDGRFDLADIDIYADIGITCANAIGPCNDGFSNVNLTGGGTLHQDASRMSDLLDELFNVTTGAKQEISVLSSTTGWSLSGSGSKSGGTWDLTSDGKVTTETTITLASGLNVIDIDTNGNDFLLDKAHIVVQGGADAFAIFRYVSDEKNFKVANGGISIGNGGIGFNNVLVSITDRKDGKKTGTHFDFSNMVVNGVAFWDISMTGDGEINLSNVQGCTQIVGDKLNFNDVRLNRCGFGGTPPQYVPPAPEPGAAALLLIGGAGLAWGMRRRR